MLKRSRKKVALLLSSVMLVTNSIPILGWNNDEMLIANPFQSENLTSTAMTRGSVPAVPQGVSAAQQDPFAFMYDADELLAERLFSAAGVIVQVAAGADYTLVLMSDGTVWSWGSNWLGQLGQGFTSTAEPIGQVVGLTSVVYISAGYNHNLALDSSGSVWAWGANWSGQLGDGTTQHRDTPIQTSKSDIYSVAAGFGRSLAVDSGGTVWTWGFGAYGHHWNGEPISHHWPIHVGGLMSVIDIAAGQSHSVALRSDGTVWTWGIDWSAAWGSEPDENLTEPRQISGLPEIVSVNAGGEYSLALSSNGTIWTWGGWPSRWPEQISYLTGVVDVAKSEGHNLALMYDGTVWDFTNQWNISQVDGLTNIIAVSTGSGHSLALESSGTLWAWGSNATGQLGVDNLHHTNVPIHVWGEPNQGAPTLTANTWEELRNAVDSVPAHTPTVIQISGSFSVIGSLIFIPEDRYITIESTNANTMRVITQTRSGQRHFIVYGNLTLGQGITLSGGAPNNTNNSGGINIRGGGVFIMNAGSIIENCTRTNTVGGAVVFGTVSGTVGGSFYLNGGTLRNNAAHGGGAISLGVHTRVTLNGGYIIGNRSLHAGVAHGGGAIHIPDSTPTHLIINGTVISNNTSVTGGGAINVNPGANPTIIIDGAEISNNTAATIGGGVRLGSAGSMLNITDSTIANNTATNGGGIYTVTASAAITLPATAYANLNIGADVVFSGNRATAGTSAPPSNRLPHIAATTFSIWNYVLNNYDVNYVGRLGYNPVSVANSWEELRNAVDAAPAHTPTIIQISSSFASNATTTAGNVITIPANRYITLESTNANAMRVITQHRSGQRHFFVYGSLTLGQGITLSGGADNNRNNSGGVNVRGGGTFTMNQGSIIENVWRTGANGGAIIFDDAAASQTAPITFNLNGGIIRNNAANRGGGISFGRYAHVTMNGGYIIGNHSLRVGVAYGGGAIHIINGTPTLTINGTVISNNTSVTGGGAINVNPGANPTIIIDGAEISNNTAATIGGGIRLGSAGAMLNITNSVIANNTAANGGGIYTVTASAAINLPSTAYANLNIDADVVFNGNRATAGASAPPDNRLPHIAATTASIWRNVLNNYDINYIGRLGEVPANQGGSSHDIVAVAGGTYSVFLTANGIEDFTGMVFRLTYDASVLSLTNFVPHGNITRLNAPSGELVFTVNIPIPQGMSWYGELALVEFTAINSGTTTIEFSVE